MRLSSELTCEAANPFRHSVRLLVRETVREKASTYAGKHRKYLGFDSNRRPSTRVLRGRTTPRTRRKLSSTNEMTGLHLQHYTRLNG